MLWLKKIYYGLLVLCLVALFLNLRKIDKENKIFLPIIFLAIVTQFVGDILQSRGISHYFIFHIYIPIEYILLCIYYLTLIENKIVRLLIAGSAAIFFLFNLLYYILDNKAFFAPSFSSFVVSAVLLSFWIICFFVELFQKEEKIYLLSYSAFWVNTGNLLFYAGCLFVMGLYFTLLEKDRVLAGKMLYINYTLNLILYIMYLIAFTCFRPRKIS